jgi:hypothetical protein
MLKYYNCGTRVSVRITVFWNVIASSKNLLLSSARQKSYLCSLPEEGAIRAYLSNGRVSFSRTFHSSRTPDLIYLVSC